MEEKQYPKKPKLVLKYNIPVVCKIKFPTPITGVGDFGPWNLWTLDISGEDYIYFAPKVFNQKMLKMVKGKNLETTSFKITKEEIEVEGKGLRNEIRIEVEGETAPRENPFKKSNDTLTEKEKALIDDAKKFSVEDLETFAEGANETGISPSRAKELFERYIKV